ncbi:MAG: hypothetical protein JRM82_02905 [Nitrososphaerota archaeon]|nr:hypothetical protein [Nitrososphaerota archaeon]
MHPNAAERRPPEFELSDTTASPLLRGTRAKAKRAAPQSDARRLGGQPAGAEAASVDPGGHTRRRSDGRRSFVVPAALSPDV